ncbi:MAG: TusE/DsrC/DsvC family sulfur relay protein [Schleiferiaceae bacterium]|jgi:tRNA 2-thiouridine synthesizing protein E|nr:TusE/DsrC/DsvC family sulfur relay protein [Schleiferiaceae bacterium]
MKTLIAGKEINVNEEGYLTDFQEWNEEIAKEIANQEEVGDLGERHWTVLKYLQDQHKNDVALTIRKVGKSGVTDIKEFYALFPGGPLKKATKIAGIPKPVGCI